MAYFLKHSNNFQIQIDQRYSINSKVIQASFGWVCADKHKSGELTGGCFDKLAKSLSQHSQPKQAFSYLSNKSLALGSPGWN